MTATLPAVGAMWRRVSAAAVRLRRLVGRQRLDGRMAEPTATLIGHLLRFWWAAAVARLVQVRPLTTRPIRLCPDVPPPGTWRRWRTTGSIDRPVGELAHQLADEVIAVLTDAGVDPILVDHAHHIHLAVPAESRGVALGSLEQLGPHGAWYLRWRRGHRWRLHPVGSRRSMRARHAESWRVFRCVELGTELAAGAHEAVEVSFWAVGAEGRRERLGVRGLERYEPDSPPTVETIDRHRYRGSAAFPVERALGRVREPIDVVYTWVDGDDPGWRTEFERWRGIERPDDRRDHAAHAARYTSHDELRYSLRSLWMYADWVRHVYVVTADQQPDWLRPDQRLTVVSHRDILPAAALPTFNSHAIESRLHHVPGLAEQFLYFNDDMFLGRPVRPEQFFTPNGLARFFESGARVPTSPDGSALAVDTAARRGRAMLEAEYGVTVSHKLHHAPYALRRSVMEEIESRFAETVTATTHSRFRHPDDLSVPSAFAHHYAFLTGRSVHGELHVGYENLGGRRLALFLERTRLGRDFDVFCLNETERWETDPVRTGERVHQFLDSYFPVPSPWELSSTLP
ncbi:MAG: sugar phosphotransferase [Ilumatobacter sp.]|nr:MAG: sugar phosphotransferase [Ilumatobacter sp.]